MSKRDWIIGNSMKSKPVNDDLWCVVDTEMSEEIYTDSPSRAQKVCHLLNGDIAVAHGMSIGELAEKLLVHTQGLTHYASMYEAIKLIGQLIREGH